MIRKPKGIERRSGLKRPTLEQVIAYQQKQRAKSIARIEAKKTLRLEIPMGSIKTKRKVLKGFKYGVMDYERILLRTPIRQKSKRRAADDRIYARKKREHLKRHPLCQITMASWRIDEKKALSLFDPDSQFVGIVMRNKDGAEVVVPRATQIHHRNRSNGTVRYLNEEYFISAAFEPHRWAETNAGEAREMGILLPVNANPLGFMPDGSKCPTTDELLRVRVKGGFGT